MDKNDLTSKVLADVSRSFYLTIRVLPRALREPVALAYLLARASDTIADVATAPASQRLGWLDDFLEAVNGGRAAVIPELGDSVSVGERVLMRRLGECVARLEALEEGDRAEVRGVLQHIIRGQRLDVERFGGGMAALPDAAALDEYTYLVAGCVGEFWTRICGRHLPRYSGLDEAEMIRLGIDFGKGLQLVNVLRDLPADLANGRCYLPADELGMDPGEVLRDPGGADPVVQRWIGIAEQRLDNGFHYIAAARPLRIRYACFLPWYLGVRTLALLRENPPLTAGVRVKVPRGAVRWAMVVAAGAAVSDRTLRRVRQDQIFAG